MPAITEVQVDLRKLTDYVLSDTHPRRRHKSRMFRARLNLTSSDAEAFRSILLLETAQRLEQLVPGPVDDFGARYSLIFPLTLNGATALLQTGWPLPAGTSVLQFITCYRVEEKA